MTNDILTLVDPANLKFIAWANNTAVTNATTSKFDVKASKGRGWVQSTLGGIVNAFQSGFTFNEGALPPMSPGRLEIEEPSKSWFMFQHTTNYKEYDNGKACSYAWKVPRPAAMAGMNELMFRIGVQVADNYKADFLKDALDPGVQIHHNVTGSLISPVEVFKSEFSFLQQQ